MIQEDLKDLVRKYGYSLEPQQILQACKDDGWIPPEEAKKMVKLADNQELPKNLCIMRQTVQELHGIPHIRWIEDNSVLTTPKEENGVKVVWKKVME